MQRNRAARSADVSGRVSTAMTMRTSLLLVRQLISDHSMRQARDRFGLGSDRCVGLMAENDGNLRFVAVEPGPTDEVIERQGEPIVAVPTTLAEALDGMMLDFYDTPDTQQFVLTHPAAGGPELMANGQ